MVCQNARALSDYNYPSEHAVLALPVPDEHLYADKQDIAGWQ